MPGAASPGGPTSAASPPAPFLSGSSDANVRRACRPPGAGRLLDLPGTGRKRCGPGMITKSGIRLGVALPQGFPGGNVDLDLVHGFARRAEALGFDDLWTVEQITGRLPMLEPVTLLANVAAVTNRIRLGIAVVVLNLRNPVQLAKALSSLDQLS